MNRMSLKCSLFNFEPLMRLDILKNLVLIQKSLFHNMKIKNAQQKLNLCIEFQFLLFLFYFPPSQILLWPDQAQGCEVGHQNWIGCQNLHKLSSLDRQFHIVQSQNVNNAILVAPGTLVHRVSRTCLISLQTKPQIRYWHVFVIPLYSTYYPVSCILIFMQCNTIYII